MRIFILRVKGKMEFSTLDVYTSRYTVQSDSMTAKGICDGNISNKIANWPSTARHCLLYLHSSQRRCAWGFLVNKACSKTIISWRAVHGARCLRDKAVLSHGQYSSLSMPSVATSSFLSTLMHHQFLRLGGRSGFRLL
jgi:hypothetical protein